MRFFWLVASMLAMLSGWVMLLGWAGMIVFDPLDPWIHLIWRWGAGACAMGLIIGTLVVRSIDRERRG